MPEAHRTTLRERVKSVCDEHGLTPRSWSLKAKLSDTYLATYLSREKSGKMRLPENGAEALAAVVGVRAEWLRFGRGPRESTVEQTRRLPSDVELAYLDAFSQGGFAAEDGAAARGIVEGAAAWLPTDRAEATRVIGRLLGAVAQVRAAGRTVTHESLLWLFLLAASPSADAKPEKPNATKKKHAVG